MSHEISQITFTTIPWGRYYHYLHLTDKENEGQWGHTDAKRKARTWAKAFGPQEALLVTRQTVRGTTSPGDHCLRASVPICCLHQCHTWWRMSHHIMIIVKLVECWTTFLKGISDAMQVIQRTNSRGPKSAGQPRRNTEAPVLSPGLP